MTTTFIIYSTLTGEILRAGYCHPSALEIQHEHDANEGIVCGGELLLSRTHYIDLETQIPVPKPAAPSELHVWDYALKSWFDPRDLNSLKADQLAAVNEAYTAATAAVSEGYPAAERESWPVQIMEARALTLDPNAPTPWLDAAAAARDADRLVLANKVIALDSAYRSIHGALSGKRQMLEKQIEAATTRDAILALVW